MAKLVIKTCPMCGSASIKRVRRSLRRVTAGKSYTVPDVEYYACPDCGEKLFDQKATDKIQSYSPSFAKPVREKRVRRAG